METRRFCVSKLEEFGHCHRLHAEAQLEQLPCFFSVPVWLNATPEVQFYKFKELPIYRGYIGIAIF